MVLAAARATARKAASAVSHHGGHNGPGQAARHRLRGGTQIRHASSTVPPIQGLGPCPPKPTRSPPNRLFTQSKNLFSYLFTQLTAPGVRTPTYATHRGGQAVRSLHSGTAPTIKSGLSFHARTALSSGPRNIFLPRPPAPGARVATNLGLGIARNFSTARPIFQNLVDNVPVIGRAFYEADLDLKKGSMTKQARRRRRENASATRRESREMIRPRDPIIERAFPSEVEDELAHYFRHEVDPVTTYLLVPLDPTTSSRVPLPLDPILLGDPPNLLPPLSTLLSLHAPYSSHMTRVESLFSRLNQAKVWRRGAKYTAYGQLDEGAAICTALKVKFVGWTEAEVRSVIGESGTGWCSLEEVWFDDADDMSDLSSAIDSGDLEPFNMANPNYTEPSSSFIMPTLDLSSSFHGFATCVPSSSGSTSLASSRPLSPIQDDLFAGATEVEYDDPWAGMGTSSVASADPAVEDAPESDAASERSWQSLGALEFSSQHLNRW